MSEDKKISVLFIGKKNDPYCEQAKEFVKLNFTQADIVLGKREDSFPDDISWWKGDYIFSYLSPWIIPDYLLERASIAAINFHPGPPEYPGIGCTNFAIYNQESTFGITCHHMAAQVDTGEMIAVRRFPLFKTDSVYSLTQRCYSYILTLFYEIVSGILENKPLPLSEETWQRKPYKRKELNELCKITPDMLSEEIKKRIQSTSFPGMPGAYVEVGGYKFMLERENSCNPRQV
jgi:methionyl-tRNA formyltransferase